MVAQKCVDPSKIEDRQMATMVVTKNEIKPRRRQTNKSSRLATIWSRKLLNSAAASLIASASSLACSERKI
jgi:hypothetical protein